MPHRPRRPPSPNCSGALPLALLLIACPTDDASPALTSATEGTTAPTSSSTGLSDTSTSTSHDPPTTETSAATTSTSSTDGSTASVSSTDSADTTTSTREAGDTESDTCGDGDLDPGEECDLGSDNDNHGGCTKLCHLATCGDGLQQPGEACDDGPANHPTKYNGCTPQCQLGPHCDDGHTDLPDEACDPSDPYLADTSKCDKCQWAAKIVFISSSTSTGALGGHSGADAQCQALASAAGLTAHGEFFRAWLSDSMKTATQHLIHADDPYILANGTLLALDWIDLTDGTLAHAIDRDEHGKPVEDPHFVWTGTDGNGGIKKPGSVCNDWSLGTSGAKGTTGWDAMSSVEWTAVLNFGEVTCSTLNRIYCFQQ